jgi:hypothetical protein
VSASVVFAVDLLAGHLVSHPEWADGAPVRILSVYAAARYVAVRYQDVHAHHPARLVTVEVGFELTFIPSYAGRAA